MRNIVIDQQNCLLNVDRGCLVIRHASFSEVKTIPISQLDSLVIQSHMQIDSHVLCMLASHGVRVQIVPARGHGQHCYLVGEVHKDVQRRLKHFALASSPQALTQWAASIVRLRLRSQRLLLLLVARDFPERQSHIAITAAKIHALQQRVHRELPLDVIRGLEGSGSAAFFADYQSMFSAELGFHNRNRRPPLDPVNVILSLSYSLLHGIFRQAAYEAGLDVSIGALHSLSYGRDSLVCDLVELRRAKIEHWVLQLFSDENLTLAHFSFSEAAGHLPCLLDKVGRSIFYMRFANIQNELLRDARQMVRVFAKRLYTENDLMH